MNKFINNLKKNIQQIFPFSLCDFNEKRNEFIFRTYYKNRKIQVKIPINYIPKTTDEKLDAIAFTHVSKEIQKFILTM
jgi:hypothetical protein